MKGQALSPKVEAERRQKISEKMKGNKRSIDPITGKHFNDHRQELSCDICGAKFLRPRSHIAGRNFCSKKCLGRWNGDRRKGKVLGKTLDLQCTECGKPFTRLASQNTGKNPFCSHKCIGVHHSKHQVGENHTHWKGGYEPYYGTSWKTARKAARERDGQTCQHCGITRKEAGKSLDVHHIKPFRHFGRDRHTEANDLSNLITLCNKCHTTADRKLDKENNGEHDKTKI